MRGGAASARWCGASLCRTSARTAARGTKPRRPRSSSARQPAGRPGIAWLRKSRDGDGFWAWRSKRRHDLRPIFAYTERVPERWCTVTVIDSEGRRHSLDLLASSTYDAAHLYVTHAKSGNAPALPVPSRASVFEVATNGRIYRIPGAKLRDWIIERRQEWKGPKGLLFSRRPTLD